MQRDEWDVAVIGGGPSGMMAAGRAAELGARVIVLEKNELLGKKLLLTGGGRCNITNGEHDTRALLAKYGKASDFLHSPFSQFSVRDTLSFFEARGVPTKIEPGKRVFPVSNKAASVRDALMHYMAQGQVEIRLASAVIRIRHEQARITEIVLDDGAVIRAGAFIIATGGLSRPDTGATGDGFKWLATLGHTIKKPDPSLVPIATSDSWVKQLQGTSLANIKVSVMQNGVRQFSKKGVILFTHFGVSGPTIINMSKHVGELLGYGPVELLIDLHPSFDHGAMNEKLRILFTENSNKMFKNVMRKYVPVAALLPIVATIAGITPETYCHSITREQRMKLIATLKGLPLHVDRLLGSDKAIVTSGGVPLNEINTRTMCSRNISNLYLTGDILDIDRPSGGFSLQLCWTTGYVAGTHAARRKKPTH